MERKSVICLINGLYGGGAERIMTWLANSLSDQGCNVYFVLTNQKGSEVRANSLLPNIKLISLEEDTDLKKCLSPFELMYQIEKKINIIPQDFVVRNRFISENRRKIRCLKALFEDNSNAVIVAFLDYSIALSLIAADKLHNRVVISERGDPRQHDKSINARYFIRKHYNRANAIVFQTDAAKSYFSQEIQSKSVIIPNPIRDGLPEPYQGVRKKVIVNFCRISSEKNLPMLVKAFSYFWKQHKDYQLQIIGNSIGEDVSIEDIRRVAAQCGVLDQVKLMPFIENVHETIKSYSMFVSSSNYEGMSNSMLEAMAIGLPTICTDCPAGGARQVIENGKNGLLVDVGDDHQLAEAMSRIADDVLLSKNLSNEARSIRNSLSANRIFELWNRVLFPQNECKKGEEG